MIGAAILLAMMPPATAAVEIRIEVDGRTVYLSPMEGTVGDAIAASRLSLRRQDRVEPGADRPIPDDGVIRVIRVEFRQEARDARIPYRTVVQSPAAGHRPYHPTVTNEGRDGVKRVHTVLSIENGREVSRMAAGETIVRTPVDQIVTARRPLQLASRGAYSGRRTMRMLATAYDPGPGSCGKWADGVTCNGKRAGYGVVAVDPRIIPLGAKLLVEGYGHGIAADVGGAIKGNRIDLGFNSRSGSFKWGKKWVTVTIID
jgi:3D (Asp-Asp-Asp) domain-containing protein